MARAGVRIEGMRELRRDLKMIDRTLPRQLNQELKKTAEPVLREAKNLAPRRTGATADSLRIGARGSKVVIYSRAPGVKTIHFGGRHPLFGNRNRWYEQQGTFFIPRAAQRYEFRIKRDLAETVEREMRRIGFRVV